MGRDRLGWQNIVLWRRDDAGDALRGGPHHAGALNEMVLAQGLGDADCHDGQGRAIQEPVALAA